MCEPHVCNGYARKRNTTNSEAIKRIRNSISILEMNHIDPVRMKDGLTYHEMAGIYLYLSTFLWREGDHDGAFAALDKAYEAARQHEKYSSVEHNRNTAQGLPSYWPRWCVPHYSDAETEMKSDSRWDEWVKKCNSKEYD